MTARSGRLLVATACALLAAGATLMAAKAQEGVDPPEATSPDCTTSARRGKIFRHRKSCTLASLSAQQSSTMKSR